MSGHESNASSAIESGREELTDLTKDCIAPAPDVFSYFSFTAPTERMKHGYFTFDAFMSYLLVFVTLAIQAVLLYCVYNKVIGHNSEWQQGIVNTGQDWNLLETHKESCNSGESLCTLDNGTFTCSPPSVQLMGRWDELDTDNDGLWSRKEVLKEKETLKCKYAVDAMEVFDVLLHLIRERKEYIWIHPDVKSGESIPKEYFTYIMGDVIMCGYRNEDMCGNLLKKGVFDAPLHNGNVPRVGKSIMSALDYCHKLLEPRGLCERMLPSTYATWKIESAQECGTKRYSKYEHQDPHDKHNTKSMLLVDYKQRQRYEGAQTAVFMTYKGCIIGIWMLLIISQVRDVFKTMAFVIQVRMEHHEEPDTVTTEHGRILRKSTSSGIMDDAVHTMSQRHAIVLGIVTVVRILMHFVLLYVGLQFLGKNTDYVALLLDGVALLFIVEVESILYERGLRQNVRTTWEDRDPIPIHRLGFKVIASRPDITDLTWFLFVAFLSIAFLLYYTKTVVVPVYDALQCTCLGEGEHCREADTFSTTFWDQYWSKDVPSSIQSIKDMKVDYRGANNEGHEIRSRPAPAPAPAPAPWAASQKVNLLKYHHAHAHLGLGAA